MTKLTKTEQRVSIFLKAEYDTENRKPYTEKKIAKTLNLTLLEVRKALRTLTRSGDVVKTDKTGLTLQEKITADVDDELCALTKRIQKKYKLSYKEAHAHTDYGVRLLMLSFPEEWLKK